MKELLTNEERLRRQRARWKRQQEARKREATLLSTAANRRSGVRDYAEKTISPHAMRFAERVFWQKRGFDVPPATAAGVFGGMR